MEWRMKRYPKKRSRLGSIPGPCVHARCLLTLPVDDTPSASSIRPSFLFHVGAKGDGREWRTECCGQKKKEEEEDEEEKRRLSGEREQSVFSESGWRAYTYIEVVLRVADIHTWRATWSYSFCFVLFSLARAARQRRRRKERTCKKKSTIFSVQFRVHGGRGFFEKSKKKLLGEESCYSSARRHGQGGIYKNTGEIDMRHGRNWWAIRRNLGARHLLGSFLFLERRPDTEKKMSCWIIFIHQTSVIPRSTLKIKVCKSWKAVTDVAARHGHNGGRRYRIQSSNQQRIYIAMAAV